MSAGLVVILIGIVVVAIAGVIVAYIDEHPRKTSR